MARARNTIRQAARSLESIDKSLTEAMASLRGRTNDGQLSGDELFSLQNNVRYQLARALSNQAQCYAAGSNDRTAALSAAVKQLKATLTQLQATDALTWQVYLDLARCYRLSGDFPQARAALTVPLAATTPVATRFDGVAESARISMAEGRPQQALDEVSRARTKWKGTSAKLDFAALEAMLMLWKAAAKRKDDVLASRWQKQVATDVSAMERNHGAFWGRRAKLAQLSVAGTGLAEGDIEIVRSSADEMYRKKEHAEAISTYQRAAELARTAGDIPKATQIEYVASLVEQELGDHKAASRRQRRLALELPSQAIAPAMHFGAIQNIAAAVRNDLSLADRYQALLEEHVERWPQAETAITVRKWLGDWHKSHASGKKPSLPIELSPLTHHRFKRASPTYSFAGLSGSSRDNVQMSRSMQF